MPFYHAIKQCFGNVPDWKFFSARGRYFSSSNLRAWKNYPRIAPPPPYEMSYFSSIFFKLCALHWLLRLEDLQRALHTFQYGKCLTLSPVPELNNLVFSITLNLVQDQCYKTSPRRTVAQQHDMIGYLDTIQFLCKLCDRRGRVTVVRQWK